MCQKVYGKCHQKRTNNTIKYHEAGELVGAGEAGVHVSGGRRTGPVVGEVAGGGHHGRVLQRRRRS
jgi:hypothetical protein